MKMQNIGWFSLYESVCFDSTKSATEKLLNCPCDH